MMDVSANHCVVENCNDTFINRLLHIEDNIAHRFKNQNNPRNSNQINFKKNHLNIFRTLDTLFLSENLKGAISHAYDHIMENIEDLDEERKLLKNHYALCGAIYYFLARRYGINIKKSTLAKILGIKLSDFETVFNILVKIQIFKDIISETEKSEGSEDLITLIPLSGVLIKRKKPPKNSKKEITKTKFCLDLDRMAIIKNPFFRFIFYILNRNSIFRKNPIGVSG